MPIRQMDGLTTVKKIIDGKPVAVAIGEPVAVAIVTHEEALAKGAGYALESTVPGAYRGLVRETAEGHERVLALLNLLLGCWLTPDQYIGVVKLCCRYAVIGGLVKLARLVTARRNGATGDGSEEHETIRVTAAAMLNAAGVHETLEASDLAPLLLMAAFPDEPAPGKDGDVIVVVGGHESFKRCSRVLSYDEAERAYSVLAAVVVGTAHDLEGEEDQEPTPATELPS